MSPGSSPSWATPAGLVANSLLQAAKRVSAGLTGALQVRNTTEPAPPGQSPDEIIGLCDQGGRHPYFRIARSDLTTAAQQLVSLEASLKNADHRALLDQILGICKALRARTQFNRQSGCVKDSEPIIVPLLPPSEVWLVDREMPLDVWKLVSAETDILASALSSGMTLSEVAAGSLTYESLAFAELMRQAGRRTVEFDVDALNFTSPAQRAALSGSGPLAVSLRELFLAAGSLLSPVPGTGGLNQWYPAIRYLDWISESSTPLVVKDRYDSDDLDSRYKGLFSEDIGVGMMSVLLQKRLGCVSIANTTEVMSQQGIARPPKTRIPDFVAIVRDPNDSRVRPLMAESKGAVGGEVSTARRKRAKTQVRQDWLTIKGFTSDECLRIAFCSEVYFAAQGKRSCCIAIDPPPEGRPKGKENAFVDIALVSRLAYSKILNFAGLVSPATQILKGKAAHSLVPAIELRDQSESDERDHEQSRRHWLASSARDLNADVLLDMGWGALILDSKVRWLLHEGLSPSAAHRLVEYLSENASREAERHRRKEDAFVNGMGVGILALPGESVR